ncbi:hypothetical protein PRZ48_005361 [Zasmidium cellare]|uniref:FAD-binding domain-containing protein n=1 Tax=Zasmidium cellare TaxID=395010 RepID=A0ABR0ET64_ZASCE|nr:hypothetical protein PRZ48_005361 [Zasmidium cellare]
MAKNNIEDVAIIGGGLGGLLLAIFLADLGIKATIYEARSEKPPVYSGPVMLLPNGLRVLDRAGAYQQVLEKGSLAPRNYSMSNDHEVLDCRECGDRDTFGYVGLRIYRQDLVDILDSMVCERGVAVIRGKAFDHIVEETDNHVTFAFSDGDMVTCSLLVGADGIHSTVREYIAPNTELVYSGILSILGFVPKQYVHLPYPDYPLPAAVVGPAGMILFGWSDDKVEEYPLATNYKMEDLGRRGWQALRKETSTLLTMMRKGYEQWNSTIQGVLDHVRDDSLFIWPFYSVPKLAQWRSANGRAMILGDAAHAIPPQGGLGANLTFEDVQSLALLMAASKTDGSRWMANLNWWQSYRMSRMDGVRELAPKIVNRRQGQQECVADYAWLYNIDVARDVKEQLSEPTAKE